jgi:site-specific recombinase XerD
MVIFAHFVLCVSNLLCTAECRRFTFVKLWIMKHITDYLEPEQVRTLLDSAQSCSTRDYLILRILFRTGVLVSELLNIRPQDLEPHNQVINIVKAKGNKQHRVIVDPQTRACFWSTFLIQTPR